MPRARALRPPLSAQLHALGADPLIAALAHAQHGVVARAQLLERGLSRHEIGHRLATARLHPLHRGVYAVGHRRVDADGQRMAAVLACGAGAVLSHRAAGALWELRPSARAVVEVTAARALRPIAGVERHRAVLADAETTTRRGIAVTTPSRTLLDLAGVLDRHAFERALEQVELRRLHDATPLGVLLDRHPRAPGAGMARRALAAQRPGITRSELEQRFLAFLDAHRLPRPRVNAYVEGLEVDAVWASARLVVELDGGAFHTTRQAFERDRRRDRALVAAGWRVVRITWRQLHEEPAAVAADLRALLAA